MNTHVETFNAAVERMERRAAERDAEQSRRSLITSFAITGIILAALGVIIAFG